MVKLYRKSSTAIEYWEAWSAGGTTTVHWGRVGEPGESYEVTLGPLRSALSSIWQRLAGVASRNSERPGQLPRKVELERRQREQHGFAEIPIEQHATLIVEYSVHDFGTPEDLDKRHRLEEVLNEVLGWTGLGNCDGGSIGSGSMEACCFVVDFPIARRDIEEALRGTEFADYQRIYDEAA